MLQLRSAEPFGLEQSAELLALFLHSFLSYVSRMKIGDIRSVLAADLGLQIPGFKISALSLNEHLPETHPATHSHRHDQILIYLRGRGEQSLSGQRHATRAGTVIHAIAGASHGFERERQRRPLCLVMDLQVSARRPRGAGTVAQLAATDVATIRSRMSVLLNLRGASAARRRVQASSVALEFLNVALGALGWFEKDLKPAQNSGTVTRRAERMLKKSMSQDRYSLADLASQLGYQRDHLNRLLKAECGQTFGQLRAKLRLAAAKQALRGGGSVSEAASAIGIDDQNYFARWFRAQIGVTPSQWRLNEGAAGA